MPKAMAKMMKGMPEGMATRMKMDQLGMRLNEGGFVAYQGKGAATALYISATKGKDRSQQAFQPRCLEDLSAQLQRADGQVEQCQRL